MKKPPILKPIVATRANSTTFLLRLAFQSAKAGLSQDAAEKCALVLRQDSSNCDAHYLLAQLALKQNAKSQALHHMHQALKNGAKRHDIQHAMAIMCLENERAAEAMLHVDKAIALQPSSIISQSLRARILQHLGRHDEAAKGARAVLVETPQNFEAIATFTASHKFDGNEGEIAQFEKLLKETNQPVLKRQLAYGLGKIFNDLKNHDKAFACFEAAATTFLQKPHPMTSGTTMDLVQAVFTKDIIESKSHISRKTTINGHNMAGKAEALQPIFIVGMPRSGTTLVEQILAAHPQITGIGESQAMQKVALSLGFARPDATQFPALVNALTSDRIKALQSLYIAELNLPPKASMIVADKMPHNFMWVGLIKLIFPDAKIIHCTRDPLDNCVSCFTTPLDETHAYAKNLATLGQYYRRYRDLMEYWRETAQIETLEQPYEAVVSNLEASARNLIAFTGLPWDDACLRFNENSSQVATNSHWQVRQPIYSTSVKRWKSYQAHLKPLIASLGDLAITQ